MPVHPEVFIQEPSPAAAATKAAAAAAAATEAAAAGAAKRKKGLMASAAPSQQRNIKVEFQPDPNCYELTANKGLGFRV